MALCVSADFCDQIAHTPVLSGPQPVERDTDVTDDQSEPQPVELEPIELKPIELKPIELKPIELKPIELEPIEFKFEPKDEEPVIQFKMLPVEDEPVFETPTEVS